jgi:hypothetical protein
MLRQSQKIEVIIVGKRLQMFGRQITPRTGKLSTLIMMSLSCTLLRNAGPCIDRKEARLVGECEVTAGKKIQGVMENRREADHRVDIFAFGIQQHHSYESVMAHLADRIQ